MNTHLHIEVARRNGANFLKTAYATPPLKVADISENRKEALRLMLMSASPGILDGDNYDMKFVVEKNVSVQLETQSFQRLFQMKQGASQRLQVHLQAGSSFCYLPHPVVPHQYSIFKAHNQIFLEQDCTLIWSDVLTPGRLPGEQFCFSTYHNCTELFLNGKLIVKDNLLLQPTVKTVTGRGLLEGFTHQATLFYLQEKVNMAEKKQAALAWLSKQEKVQCGISTLAASGLVVRLLGYSGEQLFMCIKKLASIFSTENLRTAQLPLHVC